MSTLSRTLIYIVDSQEVGTKPIEKHHFSSLSTRQIQEALLVATRHPKRKGLFAIVKSRCGQRPPKNRYVTLKTLNRYITSNLSV